MDDIESRHNRNWREPRLILSITLALFILFCQAGLANAHGGEGDELSGPAPAWMIGLIYVQLFMIPVVGLWLVRQAFNAWLRPVGQIANQGVRDDTLR